MTELASSGRYAKANANLNTNAKANSNQNAFENVFANVNTNTKKDCKMCYTGSQTCSSDAAREMSHVGQGYTIGDSITPFQSSLEFFRILIFNVLCFLVP